MELHYTAKNGADFLIREARLSDAAAYAELLQRCGCESDFLSFGADDCPYDKARARSLIRCARESERGFLLLAFLDGEAVGELSLLPPDRQRFAHTAELGIAVARRCWDQGLGRWLMTAALERADRSGLDSVFLETDADNEKAIRLYQRFGFQVYGRYARQSFYGGSYHDSLHMSRYAAQ